MSDVWASSPLLSFLLDMDSSGRSATSGSRLFCVPDEGSHPGRGVKSCSPEPRIRSLNSRIDGISTGKKRLGIFRLAQANTIAVADTASVADESILDRGRKLKSKVTGATQSRNAIENAGPSTGHRRGSQLVVRKDRERSESRDAHLYARKVAHTVSEPAAASKRIHQKPSSDTQFEVDVFQVAAEIQRMQKEIDSLKKVLWNLIYSLLFAYTHR